MSPARSRSTLTSSVGIIERLAELHVAQRRDLCEPLAHPRREFAVRGEIRPADGDLDRRRASPSS